MTGAGVLALEVVIAEPSLSQINVNLLVALDAMLREGSPLRVLPPPLELSGFMVVMAWHERFDNDPAQRWLRQSVVRAVETFT